MAQESDNRMDKLVSLAKRRGFVFPGSEIYGGLANSWDYGPLGVELKNNIKQYWWRRFVHRRNDIVGIDAALIMNPKVWEASGHLEATNFGDLIVECKKCHERYRADHIDLKAPCQNCTAKNSFTEPRAFSSMLKTYLGVADDKASEVYLRPETAQAMFVDFKNVLDTARKKLPFGIAQTGKAFRNEITPGNFIFRTREFEQMEIEYFIREEEWEKWFEHWKGEMHGWMDAVGISKDLVHEAEIPDGERAHYSKRTIDFEFDYPFGRKELYGLAYRTDFDLKNHFKDAAPYRDQETNETFYPHVIEPTWGADRTLLAVLLSAFDDSDPDRTVLKLKPHLAPYKAAVFPLLSNKEQLTKKAQEVYAALRAQFTIARDDRGNIGKRYYAQDEIGTPYCITIDFDTLEDDTVTVRNRDSATQERKPIGELEAYIREGIREP